MNSTAAASCTSRRSRNKENGQIEVKTSYAKEFSLEVLPQLSQEELNWLAAAQSAASANS